MRTVCSGGRSLVKKCVAAAFAAALSAPGLLFAGTHNLARDFSVASNPNGVWSYGHASSIGGTFTRMTVARTNEMPAVPIWTWSVDGLSSPDVHYNASSSNVFFADGGIFPPKTLWVSPGHESSPNAFGVMRFTAPLAGSYRIESSALSYLDQFSGDSEFHVVRNGVDLFARFLSAGAQSTGYSNTLSLSVGDTVDFVVGRGADGRLAGTGMKLEADLTLTGTNPPPVSNPSLVSLWRAENNALDSAGTNHGTLVGGAAFAPGVKGQGFRLDGVNDYIRIPDSASLDLSNEFTLEMWFRRDSAAAGTLLDKRNSSSTACNYGAVMAPQHGFQLFYGDPTVYEGNVFEISFSPLPTAGVWHHFSGTFRQANAAQVELRTYIDGQLVKTDLLSGNLARTITDAPLALGSARDGAGDFFEGLIDEVAIYNYALSPSQILSNYNSVTIGTSNPPPAVASNFNLTNVFPNTNPNGLWSYGWQTVIGGTFNLATNSRASAEDNGVPYRVWEAAPGIAPEFHFHPLSNTATGISAGGQAQFPPGTVLFFPGADGGPRNFGTIRFTSPSNGNYRVGVAVESLYSGSLASDTDFHVVRDNGELFAQFLPAHGATNYTNVLALNAGATLDFVVGRGADGRQAGSILKIFAWITPTSDAPITNPPTSGTNLIIVPQQYATMDAGFSSGSGVLREVIRLQDVYAATNFPPMPVWIREVRFRPSAVYGNAFNTIISNLQINLSTTLRQPEALSPTFAQNVGSNDTIVFQGPAAISSAFSGPTNGPKALDIVIPLQVPFLYDPTRGNLLIDFRNFSGSTAAFIDAGPGIGDGGSRIFAPNASATIATSVATSAEIIGFVIQPATNGFMRTFTAVAPPPTPEGQLVSVPLVLQSTGDVGGMTFVLHYNPDYLTAPEFTWTAALAPANKENNFPAPGQVRGVFAFGGGAVPAGTQTVATINFRTRSVISNTTSALTLNLIDVSSPLGAPLSSGTIVRNGSVTILNASSILGDNNSNGRLDVGDASLLLRLLAQLDPARPWEAAINDVNRSGALDSGDVVKILRTAAGIDAQPTNQPAVGAVAAKSITGDAEIAAIAPEFVRATNGSSVTVQVRLQNIHSPISGASFTLQYPASALRLTGAQAHTLGPIIPGNAAAIWNVVPANDYAGQEGRVTLAVSSALAWGANTGVLAELTFEIQPDVTNQYAWPLRLSNVEITELGYNRPVAATDAAFVTRDARPTSLTRYSRGANGSFQFTIDGEAGVAYEIETSSDLIQWTKLTTIVSSTGSIQFTDPDSATVARRFYRARPITQ